MTTIHRPAPRRAAALVLAPLLLAALSACGSDDTGSGAGAGAGADASSDPGSAFSPGEGRSVSGDAQAAIDAVNEIAPALESAMRGEDYATTVEDAAARIDDIGLTPAAPLKVGGYLYDPDQVEFTLCIEDADSGAYATYDTAPMSVRQTGDTGGCAAADLGA